MRGHVGRIVFGFLLVATLMACGIGCAKKTSDKSLVFVDPLDAEVLIQGKKKVFGLAGTSTAVWVDPRSTADYRAGHIPGALHIPFEDVRTDHRRLKAFDVIIVYGANYNSPVALATSKTLMELGFKDVRTLRGGLRAWEAAGNDVEQDEGGG